MRYLIYHALSGDSDLVNLGVASDQVYGNWGLEKAPRNGHFLVIRYEEQNVQMSGRGPSAVTVWAHRPFEMGSTFTSLDKILDRVKVILEGLVGQSDDTYRISSVKFNGFGPDFKDPGYDTLSKNAGFEILSHRVG